MKKKESIKNSRPLRSSTSEVLAKFKGDRKPIHFGTWNVRTLFRAGKLGNVISVMRRQHAHKSWDNRAPHRLLHNSIFV